jgi:hypothetical protein
MTEALKSSYEGTPPAFEPTVDLSAKDAGDEKKAAAKYTSIYGGSPQFINHPDSTEHLRNSPGTYVDTKVPVLATAYTDAPDLVPTKPPGQTGSGSPGAAGGSASPFYIDLGAARAAEQTCLDATSRAMEGYDTLKRTVTTALNSNSIFGQEVGKTPRINPGGEPGQGPPGNLPPPTFPDKLDSEGRDFAASINPQMQSLLAQLGAVIEAMGQFDALLNNSFQMYAYTDHSSAFPT